MAAGAFTSDALVASLSSRLPVSIAVDTVAWPAMTAGAAAFSVLATLLFALGPALRHSRGDLVSDLKRAAGEDARGRRFRLLPRHPLVSLQIALSLALLIASGLFLRMARQASYADLGVRADDTVLAEVDAGLAGYDEARGLGTYAAVEERLRGLPGVEAAAVGVTVPFGTVGLGRAVHARRRSGFRGAVQRPLERGRRLVLRGHGHPGEGRAHVLRPGSAPEGRAPGRGGRRGAGPQRCSLRGTRSARRSC